MPGSVYQTFDKSYFVLFWNKTVPSEVKTSVSRFTIDLGGQSPIRLSYDQNVKKRQGFIMLCFHSEFDVRVTVVHVLEKNTCACF